MFKNQTLLLKVADNIEFTLYANFAGSVPMFFGDTYHLIKIFVVEKGRKSYTTSFYNATQILLKHGVEH